MSEISDLTKALYSLKTVVAVQTSEMQHQTEAITELKAELTDNGLATVIVDKISKTFYKTTGLFGFIVTAVTSIAGAILYFLLR